MLLALHDDSTILDVSLWVELRQCCFEFSYLFDTHGRFGDGAVDDFEGIFLA